MAYRFEFIQGGCADPAGRGGRSIQLGKGGFELQQFLKQPVVFDIADFRPVVNVIQGVVAVQFRAELPMAFCRLILVHDSSLRKESRLSLRLIA